MRRGGDDAPRNEVTTTAVGVDGVHVVLGHRSINDPSLDLDLYLLEGNPVDRQARRTCGRTVRRRRRVLLDAPFRVIVPFEYGFAKEIRASTLPQKIDESG